MVDFVSYWFCCCKEGGLHQGFYYILAVFEGGVRFGWDGIGGSVKLHVVSIAMEVKTMLLSRSNN